VPDIRAAGFIVFRRHSEGIQYLTLRARKSDEWGPPKGHHERDESDLEAAWRETEEETGLGPDQLVPSRWFERRIDYRVKRGDKTVYYGLAEWMDGDVELSKEHTDYRWKKLDKTLAGLDHKNLRGVFEEAACFLKDPALRGGLDDTDAKSLLREYLKKGDPVLAHSALVAEMARAMAEAWDDDVDPVFVEACAWLHDIGRCVDHARHPLEGYRLLAELGCPGYAPTCISHYSKGRSYEELPEKKLWRSCDLSTFEPHERIVALADFMAVRESKGTIKQRHADLAKRYGPSPFVDRSLEIARGLKREFEERTGKKLYKVARVKD
jgi:putative nucleotidyltransferase with HDIG domain